MKAKNCLIFGGSGQIGRNLIRKLTKNNHKVIVVTRNIHQKSYIIKTQANAGYIDIVEANIFEEKKIRELFKKSDICINLIGILFEQKKGNTFKNIHTVFPSILAKLSKEYNHKHFIHLSALGIDKAKDSEYAKSKVEGEIQILKNFPTANILRPSVVYSVDDNFSTNFMTLLNRLPIFPLYLVFSNFACASVCSNKFFRKSESIPGNKSSKFHSGRSPRTLDDNEADAGANNFFKIFLTALI